MSYLQKHPKTGVYRFRRAVPPELRDAIGKREILKSLRTKDQREGKRRAMEEAIRVEAMFERVRVGDTISIEEATTLAQRSWRKLLDEDYERRADGRPDIDWESGDLSPEDLREETLTWCREALGTGDYKLAYPQVREIIEEEQLPVAEDSTSFKRLAHAVLTVGVKAMEELLERDRGIYIKRVEDGDNIPTPSTPTKVAPPPKSYRSQGDTLSAIYKLYLAERQLVKRSEMEADTAIRRFIEVNGDLPVRNIEKVHGRTFKDALTRIPKPRNGRLRKMKVHELVAATENDADIARLAPSAVDKQLNMVHAVFSWAIRNGYCDDNPVSNLSIRETKAGRDGRLPYDINDLTLIFNSPVFTGSGSDRYPHASFWLPLLGLYAGARLEELGQLLVRDVREKGGVEYIDINAEEESKSLKNRGSKRKVPIHPELVRCGFLKYVEVQREHGPNAQLLPDLTLSKSGKMTSSWSKWWGRYARDIGIIDRRKTFHSLRHSFKDAARDSDVPMDVHDALTGHVNGSVSSTYGSGHSLSTLARHMARLQYPGLDLTHLYIEEPGEEGRAA